MKRSLGLNFQVAFALVLPHAVLTLVSAFPPI